MDFSINAGQSDFQNRWTEQYLNDWNQGEIREAILIKDEQKEFLNFEIDWNQIEENLNNNGENNHTHQILNFEESFTSYKLFGKYDPKNKRIFYFKPFYNASEEIKMIVRIHERMHAFHHSNQEQGKWNSFANVSEVYLEFLAQIFTFKCIENTYLVDSFRPLSQRQPSIYQTWQFASGFTNEMVYELYLEIKNSQQSGIQYLDDLMKEYERVRVNTIINQAIQDLL